MTGHLIWVVTVWLLICSKNTFYLFALKKVFYVLKKVFYILKKSVLFSKKCFVLKKVFYVIKKVKTLLCSENESGSKKSFIF